MKQLVLSCLATVLFFAATAQLRVNANTCYKHSNGTYSEYYFREVQFKTGYALNNATGADKYDKNADYALIWFGQGEVSIIKLDNQIITGGSRVMEEVIDKFSFDLYCNLHRNLLTGSDQEGKTWKICTLPSSISNVCP